jgi:dynein heavy chain
MNLRTIIPDVLLSSVIIAYLGPFTQQFRASAICEWIKAMTSYSLQLSQNFSLERVLGEQIVIK